MSKVFVLDTNLKQLNPVYPGQARRLLSSGKAAVYRRYPFTIVLKTAVEAPVEPLRIKIDPGSKTTGMAMVNDTTGEVVFAAELLHQGEAIKKRLDKRRGVRRTIQGIGYQYCRALHRSDGYSYQKGATLVLPKRETETIPASSQDVVQAEGSPCAQAPRKEDLFSPLS